MRDGRDFPGGIRPDADMLNGGRAVSGVIRNSGPRKHHFHRALYGAGGQRGQQGIASQEQLAAKAAADIRGDDAHILLRDLEGLCEVGTAPGNHLVGGPEGHLIALPGRHRGMRLHRHMALVRRGVDRIQLHRGGGKGGVKIPGVFIGCILRRLADGGFFICQRVRSFFTPPGHLYQRRRRPGLLKRLCHYQRNGLMVVLNLWAAQQGGRVSLAFAEFACATGGDHR